MDEYQSPPPGALPRDRDGEVLRNSALEEAMLGVSRHDSPQSRALLYQLFLDAMVVVAIPDEPEELPVERVLHPGESIALLTVTDEDGEVLPVFSNAEAVLAWRPSRGGVVTLPARDIVQMAAAHGTAKIVINPGSPTWGYVTSREIRSLAQGRLPLTDGSEVAAEDAEVQIGLPETMPSAEVMAAVTEVLQAEASAEVAWLFVMRQGDAPTETAVAVEFHAAPLDPGHRRAMRTIVDGSGYRCADARSLLFLTADQGWRTILADGGGVEIFRRTAPSDPAAPRPPRRARGWWPWTRRGER
ncbi:SseB family protein [Streptacidiphilus sp. EB129]|uniref:SseB family protein n=1 Tax=Streptacidiphilus sp. EB129 TaxID=3156262 RepID=UPI0035133D5A